MAMIDSSKCKSLMEMKQLDAFKVSKFDKFVDESNVSIEFMDSTLSRGKYDINYVINLLNIILSRCEKYKMDAQGLRYGLQDSVKKLLHELKREQAQTVNPNPNPVVHVRCNSCSFVDIVFAASSKDWKCPNCQIDN